MGPDRSRGRGSVFLGGDISPPIVKYTGYLACNPYSQPYFMGSSSDAAFLLSVRQSNLLTVEILAARVFCV